MKMQLTSDITRESANAALIDDTNYVLL